MSVRLVTQDGRTRAECGRCGSPITEADEQVDVETALAVLGVPIVGADVQEAALALAERELFGDQP